MHLRPAFPAASASSRAMPAISRASPTCLPAVWACAACPSATRPALRIRSRFSSQTPAWPPRDFSSRLVSLMMAGRRDHWRARRLTVQALPSRSATTSRTRINCALEVCPRLKTPRPGPCSGPRRQRDAAFRFTPRQTQPTVMTRLMATLCTRPAPPRPARRVDRTRCPCTDCTTGFAAACDLSHAARRVSMAAESWRQQSWHPTGFPLPRHARRNAFRT